jgi:hypothetical protein
MANEPTETRPKRVPEKKGLEDIPRTRAASGSADLYPDREEIGGLPIAVFLLCRLALFDAQWHPSGRGAGQQNR